MLTSFKLSAQVDTLFWFAAPDVSSAVGQSPIYIRLISQDQPANVTISIPANGAFTPITVSLPANSVDSVNLTPFISLIESPSANVANNNGLKISSTQNINAIYELRSNTSKAVFSLKGQKGIGNEFYTPFQKNYATSVVSPATNASIEIVATEDNTTVLITPRSNITGHSMNTTFSVTLNKGQTYSARDVNATGAVSLAGSIISSNKPVAVTVFEGALSNAGCSSPGGDQITTVDYAGKDFIIQKSTLTGEKAYILATQNNTTVTITNSTTTSSVINWGETKMIDVSESLNFIHSSKPVYVLHLSGNGCSVGMAQVPNLFCAGTYSSVFSRSSSDSLGVMLYVRAGFEGMFELNGNASIINPAVFQPVPGTAGAFMAGLFYFNTTDIPVNSFNKVTNTGDVFGLGVVAGQNGIGSSYAYYSEFNSYPFVAAGPDDTICGNADLAVNGFVGGGSVTGYWSGTGFGSFANATSSLINTYIPSPLDTIVSPVHLILTSTGPCPVQKDTIVLEVTAAPIVNANANQTVCANNANVNLNGSISGGATKGKWTTLGSGVFSPNDSTLNATYIPSVGDTAAGTVTLVLTSTDGGICINESDTMFVSITTAPVVDAGPVSVSVCANNPTVSLSGSVGGSASTGKWTTSGNGIFSPNNLSLNPTYQPSNGDINIGSIYVYLESTSNGNCSKAKDSIQVIFTNSPSVDAGTTITACTNEPSIDLSGIVSGPTTTGEWSGGLGLYDASNTDLMAAYTPTATEVSNGGLILTLTSTNNGGCMAVSDNVQISFVAPPVANFDSDDVCFGVTTNFQDFSLAGFGPITNWEWDFEDSQISTTPNNDIDYSAPGVYNVSLVVTSSVGCSDTVTDIVEVFGLPTVDFDYVTTCSGSDLTIDFEDQSSSSSGTITGYEWRIDDSTFQIIEDPSLDWNETGTFTITEIVTTSNGCVDSVEIEITLPERPGAGFYYNTSNGLNIGASFEFIDTSSYSVSYVWDFGDGNSSTSQDPINVYFDNGTYTVTQYVTSASGCSDSASVMITINTVTTQINTLIPNAISPNGDGKNDVWKLEFLSLLYPNATVAIYNRWGQELFYSEGYPEPWAGKYNGERVADGTYFYVINLNDGASEPYKGTLLVLKNEE